MSAGIPLGVEHVLQACSGDEVVVALEPSIPVLADVGRVVAGLYGPAVVHHCKQAVPAGAKRDQGKPKLPGITVNLKLWIYVPLYA